MDTVPTPVLGSWHSSMILGLERNISKEQLLSKAGWFCKSLCRYVDRQFNQNRLWFCIMWSTAKTKRSPSQEKECRLSLITPCFLVPHKYFPLVWWIAQTVIQYQFWCFEISTFQALREALLMKRKSRILHLSVEKGREAGLVCC